MRTESVSFERAAAVRDAARRWKEAGVIDDRTRDLILREFPDPRLLPSGVWRVLTFLLVTAIILGILFALLAGAGANAVRLWVTLLLAGGSCLVAAEIQEGSLRLANRGGGGATAFWGSVFLSVGWAVFTSETLHLGGDAGWYAALLVAILVWGAAGLRWASLVYAVLFSACLFALLARPAAGRLLWLVSGSVLALLSLRGLERPSWAPPQRDSAAAVLVVALTAIYIVVNYGSVEAWWIERLRPGFAWTRRSSGVLFLSAAATGLLPVAVLVWGIRTRRLLLIDMGAVLVIFSAVTLRHYVHLAPLWAILGVAGAVLLVLALALERWLSRGPGKERFGFTAEPLFSDETRARLLQAIPVATTLSPSAPQTSEKGFTPGGGSFGGGGASDRF